MAAYNRLSRGRQTALQRFRASERANPPRPAPAPVAPAQTAYEHGRCIRGIYPYLVALLVHCVFAENYDPEEFSEGYYSP